MHTLLSGVAAALALGLALCAQSPLTTTFADNNGGSVGGAVYFDLTAALPLTITGIDINLNSTTNAAGSIDVYMCPTSFAGNEANPAAWTLIGTGTVTNVGRHNPSPVTLAAPIPIPPGTNGFAFAGIGHGFAYTNGNGTNQSYATAELQLAAGAACNVAFSGTPFNPRVVNTNLHYAIGSGNYATKTSFGDGCVESFASFYETFASGIDLNGQSLMAINTGAGYLVIPSGSSWHTSTSTPVTMANDQVVPFPLGWSLPYPGGTTASLWVSSNGFVYLTNKSAAGCCSGSATDLLSSSYGPRWAALWYDLDPASGGAVRFDTSPATGTAYITFAQVPQRGTGNLNTFQYRFDQAGNVELRWQSCTCTGGPLLVGWSPGANNRDPGPTDLSAIATLTTTAADVLPLRVAADARPVFGTTVNLTIDRIPATAALSAIFFGLIQHDPGIPLASMGMQGCHQYASMDAVVLLFATPTAVQPFVVPNNPALAGVHMLVQGASYDPAGGRTSLGAIASNGLDLRLDAN